MYIRSVPVCWEHWKQWLICHTPASKLSWASALKPVPYLAHLQHRAPLLCPWSCQMSHPGSVIHHQLHLVGGIPEPNKSQEAAELLGDASCLADPVLAGIPTHLTSGIWLSPVTRTISYIQCSASPLWIGKHRLFCHVSLLHQLHSWEPWHTESQTTDHRVKMWRVGTEQTCTANWITH